jgi:hypothetical protein
MLRLSVDVYLLFLQEQIKDHHHHLSKCVDAVGIGQTDAPYSGVALLAGHSGRAPASEHLSASQSSALQQVRALAVEVPPARLKLRQSTGNDLLRARVHVLRFRMHYADCVLEILTLGDVLVARQKFLQQKHRQQLQEAAQAAVAAGVLRTPSTTTALDGACARASVFLSTRVQAIKLPQMVSCKHFAAISSCARRSSHDRSRHSCMLTVPSPLTPFQHHTLAV